MKRLYPVFAAVSLLAQAVVAESPPAATESPDPQSAGHVFAWPFLSWEEMKPRGGTTKGAEVTVDAGPTEAWSRLHEHRLTKREQDRRAILGMAGSYRVSFDFIETLGFSENYRPPRPYFSWATEQIDVLEEKDDFISLQHSLVMYFESEDAGARGPFVMKHWRQDWKYQPEQILTYRGDLTWERVAAQAPQGRWSQAVFQVDDSPRYEVLGEWTHEGGMSVWRSDNCPRPLPRREFSVRDDYNILEGIHEIILAPNGWLHVQNNRKLQLAEDGSKNYRGTELGVNRYEAISAPDLATPASETWEKTGDYWQAVRGAWAEVIAEREKFTLKAKVDDQSLWQIHFARAAEIEEREEVAAESDAAHARATVRSFLIEN